jgi:hypothetical protein
MNVRLVVSVALLFSSYAHGQQMSHGGNETEQPAYVTANAGSEFKQQLMRRIAVEEAAARQGESAHAANVVLSRAYVQLGLLYQDVAWWERSEAALEPFPCSDTLQSRVRIWLPRLASWENCIS